MPHQLHSPLFDGAAVNVTIDHVIGTLTLTDDVPSVKSELAPTVGVLQLTSNAHTVITGLQIDHVIGTLSLSSNAHTLTSSLSPTVGVLTLSANSPTLQADISVQATIGVLTLSGGVHTVTGPAQALTLLDGTGPRRKGESWVPPQFVQVMFDKVTTVTQGIKNVLK